MRLTNVAHSMEFERSPEQLGDVCEQVEPMQRRLAWVARRDAMRKSKRVLLCGRGNPRETPLRGAVRRTGAGATGAPTRVGGRARRGATPKVGSNDRVNTGRSWPQSPQKFDGCARVVFGQSARNFGFRRTRQVCLAQLPGRVAPCTSFHFTLVLRRLSTSPNPKAERSQRELVSCDSPLVLRPRRHHTSGAGSSFACAGSRERSRGQAGRSKRRGRAASRPASHARTRSHAHSVLRTSVHASLMQRC